MKFLAAVILTVCSLLLITPTVVIRVKPFYNPPTYLPTTCTVLSNTESGYRCCEYNDCQCGPCSGSPNCKSLDQQPFNSTSCCLSDSCCAKWGYDTCHRSDGTTYQCNYHCKLYYYTQGCSGKCGTCYDFVISFRSPEFNVTGKEHHHCSMNDWSCANFNRDFKTGTDVSCYYRSDTGKLSLSTPDPDKLIGLWWFLVGLGILCGVIALGLWGLLTFELWEAKKLDRAQFVVFHSTSSASVAPRQPAENPGAIL